MLHFHHTSPHRVAAARRQVGEAKRVLSDYIRREITEEGKRPLHARIQALGYSFSDLSPHIRPRQFALAVAHFDLKYGRPYRQAAASLAQAFEILWALPSEPGPVPMDDQFKAAMRSVGLPLKPSAPLPNFPEPTVAPAEVEDHRGRFERAHPHPTFELVPLLTLVDRLIADVDATLQRVVADYVPIAESIARARDPSGKHRGLHVLPTVQRWESGTRVGWLTSKRPLPAVMGWRRAPEIHYSVYRRVARTDQLACVLSPSAAVERQRAPTLRDFPDYVPRSEANLARFYYRYRVAHVHRRMLLLVALRRAVADLRYIPCPTNVP